MSTLICDQTGISCIHVELGNDNWEKFEFETFKNAQNSMTQLLTKFEFCTQIIPAENWSITTTTDGMNLAQNNDNYRYQLSAGEP